jgi:branched-subunit amino acid ABC-type transport system permease component
MLMFGLSAVMAALGGILVAPTVAVDPSLGFGLLLGSFAAVVLGGFDNIGGTTIAAIAVMIAQQMLAGYVSHAYLEAYPYIILLGALILKPEGLFKGAVSVRY